MGKKRRMLSSAKYKGKRTALWEALNPFGETVVVAPSSQKSAISHAITISRPLKIKKIKRMNTTSNIGVKLISSSASVAWLIGDLLIIITFIIQKLSALTRALLLF